MAQRQLTGAKGRNADANVRIRLFTEPAPRADLYRHNKVT